MEKMTMEKFNEIKKATESSKMEQAVLGQSQEKGNTTSVFKTEVERETYLYTLSESSINGLRVTKEQLITAQYAIRSEIKNALAILKETAAGGTAANYQKRKAALKTIDDLGRAERMKQQAEMLEILSGKKAVKATTSSTIEKVAKVDKKKEAKDTDVAAGRSVERNALTEPGARYAFIGEYERMQYKHAASGDVSDAFLNFEPNIKAIKDAQAKAGIFNGSAKEVDPKDGTVSGYFFKDQKEIDTYLKQSVSKE